MDMQLNPAGDIRIRLLLVDDDIDLLEITSQLLSRKGYNVTPAISSEEAITKIKDKPDSFDVILTDYKMSVMNGLELAALINELMLNIPIILSTGQSELIDERQTARAGIVNIVTKPYCSNKLDEIIKNAISQKM